MLTDYKFWYVLRDDTGFIEEAAVRYYEGDYQVVLVRNQPTTRYIRTKRLRPDETPHARRPRRREVSGWEAVLFTAADFGRIRTDNELRVFLNAELAKDTLRTPISEQR